MLTRFQLAMATTAWLLSYPQMRKGTVKRDMGSEALTPFVQAELDSLLSAAERANLAAAMGMENDAYPMIFGLIRLRVSHAITAISQLSRSEGEQFEYWQNMMDIRLECRAYRFAVESTHPLALPFHARTLSECRWRGFTPYRRTELASPALVAALGEQHPHEADGLNCRV